MIDLNSVCTSLEQKRCKIHHEAPTATAIGESIKLTTCCAEFQKELQEQIDVEITGQLDKRINDMFKGFQ